MLEHLHPCGMSMPAQVSFSYRMFAFGQTHCHAMGRSINTRQGSVHFPLLKIPVDHFVLDELHLLLRIFDVLFDNLMALATILDNAARDGSQKSVRECGVTFYMEGQGRRG